MPQCHQDRVGGPVVNEQGEVVGVAVGSFESGQNVNFAIPIGQVKEFLGRVDRKPFIGRLASNVEGSWLSELPPIAIAPPAPPKPALPDFQSMSREELGRWISVNKARSFPHLQANFSSTVDIKGCQVNVVYTIQRPSESLIKYDYSTSLQNISSTSEYTWGYGGKALKLNLRKGVSELFEFESSYGYQLLDTVEIPLSDNEWVLGRFVKAFNALKKQCEGQSEVISGPSLTETSRWLRDFLVGTSHGVASEDSYRRRIDNFSISSCELVLQETNHIYNRGELVELAYETVIDLRVLKEVMVYQGKGPWIVNLETTRPFSERRIRSRWSNENRETEKALFFGTSDQAKRVGKAFVRILELCGSTSQKDLF